MHAGGQHDLHAGVTTVSQLLLYLGNVVAVHAPIHRLVAIPGQRQLNNGDSGVSERGESIGSAGGAQNPE
ncbi:hypothetical protein AAHB34_03460 [Paenarthrobacter ureafaciens]